MGEILKPFGDYGTPGPVAGVVDALRGLLAQAEAGEIVGLSFALARPNGGISFGYKVGTGSCNLLMGATAAVFHQLANDIVNVSPESDFPSAS